MTDPKRRQALQIYLVLCSTYVASQFYRVANAAIAPELMAELELSAEAMGGITGLFFLAFGAAQIPTGVLLDRYGARRTMTWLFAVAVVGAITFATAEGGAVLAIGRILLGIGCAAGLMGSMVVIARWYPEERFAALTAMLFVVGGGGTLLATTPLAWAVEVIGWRGAFLAMAGLTGIFASLLFFIVRDAPPEHAGTGDRGESWGEVLSGLRSVLANRELWLVSAIQFICYATVLTVVGLWGGPYLADVHGLDGVARGNVLLALNIAVLVGVSLYGRLDHHIGQRKWLIVAGALATAAILALLAALEKPDFWTATVLLLLFAAVGSYVMVNHAFARAVLPDHLIGRGLTFQNLAVFLGIASIQSASGLIIGSFSNDGGQSPEIAYRWVFGFLAVSLVCAAAIFANARETR
ncbi:MAG: MFS transporter [Alphaproteobacteria bacterium]|jgi:MFS family permease|nr:MFS transporter [Alphaproteobacteria bacterium]|tara:strand:+ start:878 stop:2107 length:1230 start_codon:yes stop_codon:yes gene_type:complete